MPRGRKVAGDHGVQWGGCRELWRPHSVTPRGKGTPLDRRREHKRENGGQSVQMGAPWQTTRTKDYTSGFLLRCIYFTVVVHPWPPKKAIKPCNKISYRLDAHFKPSIGYCKRKKAKKDRPHIPLTSPLFCTVAHLPPSLSLSLCSAPGVRSSVVALLLS